ncbi:MAG: tetratricopeptide repeat protein [Saprospiraceae bacterium]|nr:tetratricopeptide repeat protein [Saprospiraceae bacterium]
MTAEIKKRITDGEIEPALEQLVALLDKDARYTELAQAARVNLADYYQIKAQQIKGIVAADDARLAVNQITDNTLNILQRVDAGKFTLTDPVVSGGNAEPSSRQAWRYYLAGGIVALAGALLLWRFFSGTVEESCPKFSPTATWRVLVLPFKQTGTAKSEPETDIADGLNVYINKSLLRDKASAVINKKFDIENKYPTPEEAAEIARECGAHMIVWGKINQTSEGGAYKLDLRYKLLWGNDDNSFGDTTLSNLMRLNDEGRLIRDVEAVTRFLFVKLSNRANIPIAANFLEDIMPVAMADLKSGAAPVDSAAIELQIELAENYRKQGKLDSAEAIYNRVLQIQPNNRKALINRGALSFSRKEYSSAATDFERAAPDAEKASPELLRVRVEASTKSGQPEKAERDLQVLIKKQSPDGAWLQKQRVELQDSSEAIAARKTELENQLLKDPKNTKLRQSAAQSSLAIGDNDAAIKHATIVTKRNPTNVEAVRVKVVANIEKGDLKAAKEEVDRAKKAGVTAKTIQEKIPEVMRLDPNKQ